jgi:hypothetical protein
MTSHPTIVGMPPDGCAIRCQRLPPTDRPTDSLRRQIIPLPRTAHQDRRATSDFASWPEAVPEPPPPPHRLEDGTSTLVGRIALVVSFAAVIALVIIFARPITQSVLALFDTAPRAVQTSKSLDLLTPNNVPADDPVAPATRVAEAPTPQLAAPVAQPAPASVGQSSGQTQQQATLSSTAQPLGQEPGSAKSTFRGVTDSEIRFGISAAFSGAAKELGQNMKLGIEAAFNAANARGGVHGRMLRLIAADDGYEPVRTAETMKRLYEKDQVFGVVGNVGTPTATVALPYALERKMLFFGAFTGAGLLRSDPPDRYVFNYRASYAEETSAMVHYLVKVKAAKAEPDCGLCAAGRIRRLRLLRRNKGCSFAGG